MEKANASSDAIVFSVEDESGWRRRRKGTGFSYQYGSGKALAKPNKARVQALAIPPAWADVWICPDPNGHLQATGYDQRGRKQYLYNTRWSAQRSEGKFATLIEFAEALPALRTSVEEDLRRRTTSLPLVAASVVWLLDHTLIRVGNQHYATQNKSFGLTTLRNRHVNIDGAKVRFRFKGKSGKQWDLQLTDRRIARIVRTLQELPGQSLFQYTSDDALHSVTSRDVNEYIAEKTRADFSSKDFRTWAATVRAHSLLVNEPVPDSARAQKLTVNKVLDAVASRLGNTRAVSRSSYVHPAVLADWLDGTLKPAKRKRSAIDLPPDEQETLAYLKSRAAAEKTAQQKTPVKPKA